MAGSARGAVMDKAIKLVYALISIVVLAILYKFVQLFNRNQDSKQLETVLDDSESNISKEEAKLKAETLYNSMRYVGTSDKEVKRILDSLTQADYKKVFNAFGLRKYSLMGESPLFGTHLNLTGWLKEEISYYDRYQHLFGD